MTSLFSNGEFDSAHEDWLSQTKRLQLYFTANDIINATKQRVTLLSACGTSTYQLMRSLLVFENHPSPKPSATPPSVMVYFNFHSCSWHQKETISDFIAELKKLVEHCEFGDSFNRMLRNRLVCGSNNQRI